MIKFLKNFFNLGRPTIYDEIDNPKEPNEINTTWQYKRLRKLSINYASYPEDITNFIYLNFNYKNQFINDCMEQSIKDDDLPLFREIYLYQRKRTVSTILPYDDILDYAYKALKINKNNIFEFLLEFYQSQYSDCVSYNSDFKVRRIMTHIIDNEQPHYFDLLKKYNLTNFTSYITEMLDSASKVPNKKFDIEIDRLTFVLAKFSDQINKKDLSRYLNSLRSNGNKKSLIPEEIIGLFDNLDFVKKKHDSKQLFEELNSELKLVEEKNVPKTKKMKV